MKNRESLPLLSRQQCAALRGVAIIGIFLHNYCHWLNPIVKENEYTYIQHNVDWLTQVLTRPDWNLPVQLLSFFGHYGVPIFFFLSAYGLVMKYERAKNEGADSSPFPVNAGQTSPTGQKSIFSALHSVSNFIGYHYLKLFRMMIVGFVAFTMLDAVTPDSHKYQAVDIIAQLLMFNNVLPDPDDLIWPGPYWFFGVMLQFYIVYRLFLCGKDWKRIVGMIGVCWLMQIFCDPESEILNRIRYNFMGGFLPFGAGLLYARYGRELAYPTYWAVLVLSAILIFAFGYDYQLWFWIPLFVCTFCIALVKVIPQTRLSLLEWMGGLSAALFVCHPITRKIFIPISRQGDIYTGILLYIIASIAIAWLFKELFKLIPNPKLINN